MLGAPCIHISEAHNARCASHKPHISEARMICASSKKYQRRDGRGAYDMRLECKKYAPRITFSVVVYKFPNFE